jgi:hypothetical protein
MSKHWTEARCRFCGPQFILDTPSSFILMMVCSSLSDPRTSPSTRFFVTSQAFSGAYMVI